jgi:hypothetical protein
MAGTISGERLSSEGDEALTVAQGGVVADAANDQDAALALQKLDRDSEILVVGCGNSSAHEFVLVAFAHGQTPCFVRFFSSLMLHIRSLTRMHTSHRSSRRGSLQRGLQAHSQQ